MSLKSETIIDLRDTPCPPPKPRKRSGSGLHRKWLGHALTILAAAWVMLIAFGDKAYAGFRKAAGIKIHGTAQGDQGGQGSGLPVTGLNKTIVIAVSIGAAVILCSFFVPRWFSPTCYQIAIDGKAVAFVEDSYVAEEALDAVVALKSRQSGARLLPAGDVSITPVKLKDTKTIYNKTELTRILADKMAFTATGYAINVSGRDVVILASKEDAEAVLEGLKNMFVAAATKEPGVTLKEVRLSENVSIGEKKVEPTAITDVETAKRVLLRGTNRIRTYEVSRGDSLWSIASRSRMSVEDLRRANPEMKGDLLQIGQTLNLVVPEPFLTVQTVEEKVVDLSIPHPVRYVTDGDLWPWESVTRKKGKDGIKRVVYRITRENGIETGRETISSEIIEEPVEAVVAKGSRAVSGNGTGKLVWPVRGVITSYYGARRRDFHQGIDIAAPTGTSIVAADSGTVVFSGYYGGYGKVIFIDHGKGMVTIYGHNSVNLVSAGEEVKKGQVIARVGRTGNATGAHLHFEVRVDGRSVNPIKFYQ